MAEQEHDEQAEVPKTGGKGGLIKLALVGLVSAGAGFAVPVLLPALTGGTQAAEESQHPEPAFLSFGQTIVNLDEGRLNRYLRVNITLQVDKTDETDVSKLLERNRVVLKNWLLSHMADKSMDEIRGAAGQNRMRREIQDYFNSVLFPDGFDRIHDVLFEEFNIQ